MTSQEFLKQLDEALRTFQWQRADALVAGFIAELRSTPEMIDDAGARKAMNILRKKRRFPSMMAIANALPANVLMNPQVRRQIAQADIELGAFFAAEDLLSQLAAGLDPKSSEYAESKGLLGRLFKQQYLNANADGGPIASTRRLLQRAIDEYAGPYESDPKENFWHGINVVACLDRARRDGMAVQIKFDAEQVARDIAEYLEEVDADKGLRVWEVATLLESRVALVVMSAPGWQNISENLPVLAKRYVEYPDADAFEIRSTLRQLVEVWQLTESKSPGSDVLPVLRSALLKREGGVVEVAADEAEDARKAGADLERRFGGKFIPPEGLRMGLERTPGVARIEKRNGMPIGTGFLVDARAFFPAKTGRLLLTNAHVVNKDGTWPGSRPSQTRASFEGVTDPVLFEEVLWTSPVSHLDACFLVMNNPPNAASLPIGSGPYCGVNSEDYLYIIGHPSGGKLMFSLQDNLFLERNERLLRYRTPTEKGSSGSPVLDDNWDVVALHHKGSTSMPRLNGGDPEEANEGVCICAIREATRNSGVQ
jgi:hypothetical protein